MSFSAFLNAYGGVVHSIAQLAVSTLELVGVLVIVVGSARAVVQAIRNFFLKENAEVLIALGKALALALEFKLGAEVINTVLVRDMAELATLAIVVIIRALLAILIRWEIRSDKGKE